jgi:hypothetical protein
MVFVQIPLVNRPGTRSPVSKSSLTSSRVTQDGDFPTLKHVQDLRETAFNPENPYNSISSAAEDGPLHFLLVIWMCCNGITGPTDPSIDWPELARSGKSNDSPWHFSRKIPAYFSNFRGFSWAQLIGKRGERTQRKFLQSRLNEGALNLRRHTPADRRDEQTDAQLM